MIPSSAYQASLSEADAAAELDVRCYTNAWDTTVSSGASFTETLPPTWSFQLCHLAQDLRPISKVSECRARCRAANEHLRNAAFQLKNEP